MSKRGPTTRGNADEEAALSSFDSPPDMGSNSSGLTNQTQCPLPGDNSYDFFQGWNNNATWDPNFIHRTMGVDASQLADGEDLESPPRGAAYAGSSSQALMSHTNSAGNKDDNESKAFEPIPLRNNNNNMALPLVDALQLQRPTGFNTSVSDVIRRDCDAIDLDQQSQLLRGMPTNMNNSNMSNAFMLNQYEVSNNSAAENMQQVMGKINYDPSLFHVNGAPSGMGSMGWCTNLPNPHYYSIPGNNGVPWAQAQPHPGFMGGGGLEAASSLMQGTNNPLPFLNTSSLTQLRAIPVGPLFGAGGGSVDPLGMHHDFSPVTDGRVHVDNNNNNVPRRFSNQEQMDTSASVPSHVLSSSTKRESGSSSGLSTKSNKNSNGGGGNNNNRPRKKLIANPNMRDVCFALIKHPGTKAWRTLVDSLANQADVQWSEQLCDMIKTSLQREGRRFLVCETSKTTSNSRSARAGAAAAAAHGNTATSKAIRNGNWVMASEQEIWLRTRQRFRDCRKSGRGGDSKPKGRRPSELKTSTAHVPPSHRATFPTGSGVAATTIDLAAALQGAIDQCHATVHQLQTNTTTTDHHQQLQQHQQQIRLVDKGERAKERLDLLEPMKGLRWSHVLEKELQQQTIQRNSAAYLPLVMEKGRAALRIKKLKKAETQMVNFIQALMESSDSEQQSAAGGEGDEDEATDDSHNQGGADDEDGGGDDNEDDGAGGDEGADDDDDDDGDEKQNGNDHHESDETESDDGMEEEEEEEEDDGKRKKSKNSSRRHRSQYRRKEALASGPGFYQFDLVTVFQAAPLAYRLKSGEAHPLPLLDIDYEKNVLNEAFQEGSKQSGKRIEIDFEVATTDRLGAFLVNNESRVMHLSCHGHPDYLALDNGWGGMQILHVQALEQFIRLGAGNLDLVFLSSCSSRPAGEVFVAAGVSHVVCCYQSHKPRDVVAIEFAKNFYRALASGMTVKAAFQIARHHVQVSPSALANQSEAEQFLLLPEKAEDDPYHDVQIFLQRNRRFPGLMIPKVSATKSFPYLPRPSRDQTLHMFHVLELLAKANVVKVTSENGAKRLAASLAGYVRARPQTMKIDRMFWLPPIARADDDVSVMLRSICTTIFESTDDQNDDKLMDENSDYYTYLNEALSYMVEKRCLFVINGKRFASQSQSRRLERFMCDLLDEMDDVKIILACADGQEQYKGPPRHREQVRVYEMAADDSDRNVRPMETAVVPSPQRPVPNSKNEVVPMDHDGDNDSVSDLSTFSVRKRKRFEPKQATPSNPFSSSEIPLEIVGGFKALRIDQQISHVVDDSNKHARETPKNGNSCNNNGKGFPTTVPMSKVKTRSDSIKALNFGNSDQDDDTSTSSESTASGAQFPRPNKTLDAFDATMSSLVSARISRGLYSSETADSMRKTTVKGAATVLSAVTPFLKRSFTQGIRLDSSGRPCLYGRDKEISLLKDVYNRITQPGARSEIVVVHGPSGTGKSTLVKHMVDFLAVDSIGIFAMGKFDEIRSRAKPYSAAVDAFSRLIGRIARGNDAEAVKLGLQEVLGSEMVVLAELIPAIVQLTGEMAAGESNGCTGNGFAFTRFKDLFRSFMRTVSSPDRPIVLFLDDLQWADKASRLLMESLASDPESKNVLFVWAYRDDETGNEAPRLTASVSKNSSLRLSDVSIGAIDSESLNQMVAHLSQMSPEKVKPLSDLLSRRTGGNIHFAIQFLHMLQQDGFVVFSDEDDRWDWNVELIDIQTVVTDNVAKLLTASIARQPSDVQSVLQLASCLGFFFDVKLLETISRADGILIQESAVSNDDLEEMTSELWSGRFLSFLNIAKAENFIIPTNDPRMFRFSHDRVRQCAYEMIQDTEKRERLHLRIGTLIWDQIKSEASDDLLPLLAVDQLNRGSRHVKDEDARIKLAKLNLDCAKRAGMKSAYPLAAELLDKGIRLLDNRTKWLTNTYNLCLELYNCSAEMECSLGNFDSSDDRVKSILTRAHGVNDKVRAHYVWLDSLGVRRRLEEGITEGIELLNLVGEKLPRRPGMMKILLEMGKTKRAIKGLTCDEIRLLTAMKDERKVAAMRVLSSIALFAWHSHDNNLLAFVFLRMTRVTLNHGLCKFSPFAFAAFGMLLGNFGDIEQADAFGNLALKLLESAKTKECHSSTQMMVCIFVEHLRKPLSIVKRNLSDAYQVGMENGDVQYACLSLSSLGGLIAVTGEPLRSLRSDLHRHRRIYQEYNQRHADVLIAPWLQFALNMTGEADNVTVLTGEAMDEANLMSEADTVAKVNVHFIRMKMLYILGYVEAAGAELEALEKLPGSTDGTHFMTTFIIMYCGLVSLAMAQRTRRRRFVTAARKYVHLMAKFVREGRLNCRPMYSLLLAIQKLSLADKSSKAEIQKAFDDAIAGNSSSGFLPFTAIANEMVGEFMMSCQDQELGHFYLRRAWQLYSDWQAEAKLQLLETKYRALRNKALASTTHPQHKEMTKDVFESSTLQTCEVDLY